MNYYELEPEDNTFSNIVVDLTHKCQMTCANCYIPNREIPDLDEKKLYEFLKKLPSRTYIRLIGAEPTMREDIFEIISTVKKLGHRPSLTTNGLKLAQRDYVKKLKEAGLRLLLHSMNGADDDKQYQNLDNGKWATVKVRALENIFAERLPVNTGTIIAKGINETTFARQPQLFGLKAAEAGIDFDKTPPYNKIKPVIRLKSVGAIGRYMKDVSYTMDELIDMAIRFLNVKREDIHPTSSGLVKNKANEWEPMTSYMFKYKTIAGHIYVRLIDWQDNDEGVIDHGNPNRGRLTQDFKVAPFFEHVKRNEFQY